MKTFIVTTIDHEGVIRAYLVNENTQELATERVKLMLSEEDNRDGEQWVTTSASIEYAGLGRRGVVADTVIGTSQDYEEPEQPVCQECLENGAQWHDLHKADPTDYTYYEERYEEDF